MKRTITRKQFYEMDQEFTAMAEKQPGLYILNEGKINEFRKKNAMQLKITRARFIVIQDKYVVKDEQGFFKTEKMPNGSLNWVLKDKYIDVEHAITLDKEQVAQYFDNEMKQFFLQQINIEY